jgi:hypothetical protein
VELLLRSPGVCTRRHLNYLRRNGTTLLWYVRRVIEGGCVCVVTTIDPDSDH